MTFSLNILTASGMPTINLVWPASPSTSSEHALPRYPISTSDRLWHVCKPTRHCLACLNHLGSTCPSHIQCSSPRLGMSRQHSAHPTLARHIPVAFDIPASDRHIQVESDTSSLCLSHPGHTRHIRLSSICPDHLQHVLTTPTFCLKSACPGPA